VFRVLRLVRTLPAKDYDVLRIRILDFYLIFPEELGHLTFPRELVKFKSEFRKMSSKYNSMEDPFRMFSNLEPYHEAAFSCLASYGYISNTALREGKIRSTALLPSEDLQAAIDSSAQHSPDLIRLLTGPLAEMDLYGRSGLKARSDLFEHRYDPT
jgi:ABC-3C biological conflict system middle component